MGVSLNNLNNAIQQLDLAKSNDGDMSKKTDDQVYVKVSKDNDQEFRLSSKTHHGVHKNDHAQKTTKAQGLYENLLLADLQQNGYDSDSAKDTHVHTSLLADTNSSYLSLQDLKNLRNSVTSEVLDRDIAVNRTNIESTMEEFQAFVNGDGTANNPGNPDAKPLLDGARDFMIQNMGKLNVALSEDKANYSQALNMVNDALKSMLADAKAYIENPDIADQWNVNEESTTYETESSISSRWSETESSIEDLIQSANPQNADQTTKPNTDRNSQFVSDEFWDD